jgi:hypothetical protein
LDTDDLALWYALNGLMTNYWADVDHNGGSQAHEFYLPEALYIVGNNRFEGAARRPRRLDVCVRMGGHRGLLSQAEGCWTFDARDRMPRSSRLTAHHPGWRLERGLEPSANHQRSLLHRILSRNDGRPKLWRDDLLRLRGLPFDTGPGSLFVCYFATAELSCIFEVWGPRARPHNIIDAVRRASLCDQRAEAA